MLFGCRRFTAQTPQLSYMRIFAQRMQVAGSIIIDGNYIYVFIFI